MFSSRKAHLIKINVFYLFLDGNGNEAAVHDFLTSLDVNTEVWIGLHQATPLDRFHWV